MSVPQPWNNKNNCFIYADSEITALLNEEQINRILSINTDFTTYIRSNLAITDGSDTCIPNVFESINITYSLVKNLLSEMNSMKSQIQTLSSSINNINAEINSIKEQIEELKPE